MDGAVLYVLAAPLPGTGIPGYLMHEVGGVDCVLAYTDLERLVECCGENQPWLGVRIDALMADLRDQQLPGPVVNLPLAPAARWTAGGPPWERSRLKAADRADVPGTASEGPAPDASEFADWDDDTTIASSAGTVPDMRKEWWQ